jgi:ribosomal protein S18 acetylase RimI-like enzyme
MAPVGHTHWIPTSRLGVSDRERIEALLAERPWQDHYYRCALADLETGLDNRAFLIGRQGRGLALLIAFQGTDMVTVVGELDDDELAAVVTVKAMELHLPEAAAEVVAGVLGERLRMRSGIHLCERSGPPPAVDGSWTELTVRDYPRMRSFYSEYYPETVLSPWMLDLPFAGVEEGGEIVACAGTMVAAHGAAHVGHFITHPEHRGKGLASRVGAALVGLLAEHGFSTVRLGVKDYNPGALRVYRRLGFEIMATPTCLQADSGRPF